MIDIEEINIRVQITDSNGTILTSAQTTKKDIDKLSEYHDICPLGEIYSLLLEELKKQN